MSNSFLVVTNEAYTQTDTCERMHTLAYIHTPKHKQTLRRMHTPTNAIGKNAIHCKQARLTLLDILAMGIVHLAYGLDRATIIE